MKEDEDPQTDYDFKEGVQRDEFDESIYSKINPKIGKFTSTSDATGGFRVIIQKYIYKISQEYQALHKPPEPEKSISNSKAPVIIQQVSKELIHKRKAEYIHKFQFGSDKGYQKLKNEL